VTNRRLSLTDPWSVVQASDRAVDRAFERFRGRRWIDRSARVVSNLADYGFVWAAVALVKGRRGRASRRLAVRSLATAGVTSYTVNLVVKRLVGRQRPESEATRPGLPVRTPSSSSFPSGHTLAAYCTTVVFAESIPELLLLGTFATSVAASRLYLQAHHASDVVGGAAIGLGAGIVARMLAGVEP
jgi:membrane-associated phospholipid phosphatase